MGRGRGRKEVRRGISSLAGNDRARELDIQPRSPVSIDPLDGLARAVASPLPRRHVLKLGGAALTGLFLGGLRPSWAKADHCIGTNDKHCQPLSGDRPFCCPQDTVCCTNGVTNSCCSAGGACPSGFCEYEDDLCGPGRYLCDDGCCPDENNCCGGRCCSQGQVCVNKRCRNGCPNGREKCGKPPKCCKRGQRCRHGRCR